MSNKLIETIISTKDSHRNRSIHILLQDKTRDELLNDAEELEVFRKRSGNLYHKVRASLFLFVIYRFYLQKHSDVRQYGEIPFEGVRAACARDFEKALEIYSSHGSHTGAVFSAIADSYYKISFDFLMAQVKLTISSSNENYYLYNIATLDDYPYSVPSEAITPEPETGLYPVGKDVSPVRLDPSHSGWSDIFFLGMDFPEGAKVVNVSVDLRLHGSKGPIAPPCECYCRFIEEPAIHLTSIDLNASKKIKSLQELFNFGNDYLSLLKAGVVASGIVPPCFEKKNIPLRDVLHKLFGRPGGIELVTKVKDIPKGSRLAVSTTLLATIITRLMRFSGQINNLSGGLKEDERRTVVSRAILGEWLGGSGGGWQDSGGLWPGIKVITGKTAKERDPEFGVSRGCLLPEHTLLLRKVMPEGVEDKIVDSIVLVHGGISQNVGPVLEMVTEKYLLKYESEWQARLKGIGLFNSIVDALKTGNMKELGRLTTVDWEEAVQKIIPWVNNSFTDDLINSMRNEFKADFWGFLMLGGMSGGGMAFIVNPSIGEVFKKRIAEVMCELKQLYNASFPFIIDPVVYDFKINHKGIQSQLLKGKDAVMPRIHALPNGSAPEVSQGKECCSSKTSTGKDGKFNERDELEIKKKYGFDKRSHEHMKKLLKGGQIGLAKNRLPLESDIQDPPSDDIMHFENEKTDSELCELGSRAIENSEVAVVTFAGGMGSRWTGGAAVVKPINPFMKIDGKYRSFIESHLAKSRKTGQVSGTMPCHVFTTSYLTHDAIVQYLENFSYFHYEEQIYISPAHSIGHRVYPMERDLRFHREEQLRQKLDEHSQKVQDDIHKAFIEWAKKKGEGEDYSENKHMLRFNPPGHWYEIPNLLKNGVLARMIQKNQDLKYLFCHNVDTLGASVEPGLLGMHIANHSPLTFEVTPRRIEDAGGGLAKVNGHVQLIEGLAMPREEDEYKLSYYNTLTNWITIDSLLEFFGLNREILLEAEGNSEKRSELIDALYALEKRIPVYVTIKDVKYLWGNGQEDIYPVAQFEKLWGDMSGLKDLNVSYISVSRERGGQLKEPSFLDMWVQDGSFEYFKSKCAFL